MESTNRPYVDPATEPGDAGTEPWADDRANSGPADQTKPRPVPEADAPPGEGGAVDGSPADQFLTEDAVNARREDSD